MKKNSLFPKKMCNDLIFENHDYQRVRKFRVTFWILCLYFALHSFFHSCFPAIYNMIVYTPKTERDTLIAYARCGALRAVSCLDIGW